MNGKIIQDLGVSTIQALAGNCIMRIEKSKVVSSAYRVPINDGFMLGIGYTFASNGNLNHFQFIVPKYPDWSVDSWQSLIILSNGKVTNVGIVITDSYIQFNNSYVSEYCLIFSTK